MLSTLTRYGAALLSLALLFSLSACSQQDYADDLPCSELMDAVEDQIPVNFGYETYGAEHLRYYFDDDALPDDRCLRYSARAEDINEVGIFHTATQEEQKRLREECEEYLEELREEKSAFIGSYAPEELPKLERAEVRCFGNYTVYAIASDDDRALIFETVEKKLKEKK